MDDKVINALDIGCGIGWSSFEIARRSRANVLAVDLSESSIIAAKELFQHPNIEFRQLDITSAEFTEQIKFDLIVMVDVFEHIPKENRIEFYKLLNRLLSHQGKVALTCPTVYHQKYLRDNNPGGLQPVDEDVDLSELIEFGKAINAGVAHFQYKSIWNHNDYFHAIIQREVPFSKIKQSKTHKIQLENIRARVRRLKKSNYSDMIENNQIRVNNRFRRLVNKVISKI
jgi:cyclopropane fatty-acyl-phospholipid synthase-like methyltransferase